MSERTSQDLSEQHRPLAPLLAVAAASFVSGFALIQVSAGSASAWLGMVLGIGVTFGGGLLLGRWWPGRTSLVIEPGDAIEPAPRVDAQAPDSHTSQPAETVSALIDEEHIVGLDDVPAPVEEPAPAETQDTPADRAYGHDVITPEQLINDDYPTVAMHIPAAKPVAIDDKPQPEALAAKDEVIRSLEDIVKENRDRWSNYEAEREKLRSRIAHLEAELSVASDLIENGSGDESGDAVIAPQVLNRA